MAALLRDLRYALRTLSRAPGFAAAAVVTLALGIGANTMIFSVVNGFLFRPLPVEAPERLAALYSVDRRSGATDELGYRDYVDFRDRSGAFADIAGQLGTPVNLTWGDHAEIAWSEIVTENYFTVLGLRPLLGRFFTAADATAPGAGAYVVLSHELWQRRFGGERDIAGRAVSVNGHPFTVLGVAPPRFRGTRLFGYWPELWLPLGMLKQVIPGSDGMLEGRGGGWLIAVGRLKPGTSVAQARATASTFAAALARDHAESNRDVGAEVIEAKTAFDNPRFVPAGVLSLSGSLALGAAGLVLLIACANVANLLLARASGRQREFALRLALGASRARLVRQLLTESLVLGTTGAIVGFGLAQFATDFQALIVPRMQFRVGVDVAPDVRVLLYASVVSLCAVVAFGLLPALRATRPDLIPSLKGETVAVGRGRRRLELRELLAAGQIALSVLLLVAAGIFLRSFLATRETRLGFDRVHRSVAAVNVGLNGYDSVRASAFFERLRERVAAGAGVTSVSYAFPFPLEGAGRSIGVYVAGHERNAKQQASGVGSSVVDRGYFATAGTRMLEGREFTDADRAGTGLVAVVNQHMAATFWAGGSAVGRQFRLGEPGGPPVTIVGVAEDGKYGSALEAPQSYLFLPLSQHPTTWLNLVVHARTDPMTTAAMVRESVGSIDPDVSVFGAMSAAQLVENALNPATTAAITAGLFGALALALALIGVYGVVSYLATLRSREVGVRMALGAATPDILRMILGRAALLALIGIGVGVTAALAMGGVLSHLVVGVSARDPLTIGTVSLVVALVVTAASVIPARRAARVDPMVALRYE